MSVKMYSAIDLLDKILEFTEITPNMHEWNLKSLKSNPPRQIRFRQIEALLSAFFIDESNQAQLNKGLFNKVTSIFSNNIKISIESFLRGEFLKERTIDEYSDLIQFITNFVNQQCGNIAQTKEVNMGHLFHIFPKLINYKRQVRNLLKFNSGWLEASSTTSIFSVSLTNSISNNLIGKHGELDTAIELFINPKKLIFTEEKLIAEFSFPVENLDEADYGFM